MDHLTNRDPAAFQRLLPRAALWAGATVALLWLAHATASCCMRCSARARCWRCISAHSRCTCVTRRCRPLPAPRPWRYTLSPACVMLLMAAAFGLAGALIAPPVTAFLKAYYEEFTLARQPQERTAAGTQGILPRRRCPCPFLPHGNALRCGAGRPHPRLRQPGAHGSYNGATGSSRHGMGLPSRIYDSSLRMWTLKL
jgi:hypothetical protein